ncbi:MAG: HAMP domain-containing sensor histidine kinase [Gemmatimonadales bacterium]|nr:HAMP domain-containing sensor histidine kinase [Gemmatimonadales bacterium]
MALRDWLQPPRRLVVLFLLIALIVVTAMGGLAWRFLDQDRALERQRTQDRLERTADVITAALGRGAAEAREALTRLSSVARTELRTAAARWAGTLKADALVVILTADGVEGFPSGRLLYRPVPVPSREAPAATYAVGEGLEFRQRDLVGAAAAFRALAASRDSAVRAGALLRLARVERKAGQLPRALESYARLTSLGTVPVGRLPAALVARHARLAILRETGRAAEAEREAATVADDLRAGTWPLTRAVYRYYAEELAGYALPPLDAASRARLERSEAIANAVGELWARWNSADEERRQDGSEVVTWRGHPVLLLWRGTATRGVALVAGPDQVERGWLAEPRPTLAREQVTFVLADASGNGLIGSIPAEAGPQVTRTAAETRLPWTLRVASGNRAADLAQYAERRRLVTLGLAALTLLVVVGLYAAIRGVSRELEVARLQSEFVAAVSHELRTPLTALRQFTELLVSDRVRPEEQRRRYYGVMQREADRLQRLVEGLLDFGRMEAGALEFHRTSIAVPDWVRDLVQEFRQAVAEDGWSIELADHLPGPTRIRADAEAVGRALWNLLDNAVKYSPDHRTVWVEVRREGGQLVIAVRDRGIGISAAERATIFDKFVRGASAGQVGAKGTGIGLAMVRHIVDAHHGTVTVESEPGTGSTFTLRLPVEE